jgi:Mg-chelatase subunit ChlD
MDTAILAAAVVGESVDWVGKHTDGHVAVAVTGFDTDVYPVVEFGENWRSARVNLGAMQARGGTMLSPATERMASNILSREEERKVVICITDGMPSQADVPVFKSIAADLTRCGVDLYGILIGCDDSFALFQHKARIDKVEELPNKLAEMVMRSILN